MTLTAPHAGRHRRPEPWPGLITLVRAFLVAAPHRVVWGSAWPQSMPPVFKTPIPDHALLLGLPPDHTDGKALLHRILVDSPAERHGFPA